MGIGPGLEVQDPENRIGKGPARPGETEGGRHADADTRRYRDQGEPLLPRRDDVRCVGQSRSRGEHPDHSCRAGRRQASVLPTCQKYGMGVIAWSPLAGGWLTGRYRQDKDVDMSTTENEPDPD